MEKYKYTGPTMLVGDHNQFEFVKGSLVKAEVNINIATIKSFYHQFKEDYEEIPPVYVAAKYLEPIEPDTIHFDPKDGEPERKPFNTEDFFDELNESFKKFPFFSDDSISQGWDRIFQKAWREKYGDTYYTPKKVMDYIREHGKEKVNGDEFYMVSKDEAKKHYKPEDGSSWTAEILAGLHNRDNDSHEVGGNHYKMAIEPWDYIQANGLGFDEGNIVKYASRHKQKNGAEDIKKIISYAKHILKTQYGEEYNC